MSHTTKEDRRRLADLTPTSHPGAEKTQLRALADEIDDHDAKHADDLEPGDYGGVFDDHDPDHDGPDELASMRRRLRKHNRKSD